MNITDDMMQKVKVVVGAALQKIGAEGRQKKVDLAVKFVRSQPLRQIVLDDISLMAVAIDIATVFPWNATTDKLNIAEQQ